MCQPLLIQGLKQAMFFSHTQLIPAALTLKWQVPVSLTLMSFWSMSLTAPVRVMGDSTHELPAFW